MKHLTDLRLKNNQITDILHIRELENLSYLDLRNNQITDFSVLKELKNLRELSLSGNQMDKKQKAGLKEVIPGLVINEWGLEL